MSRRYHREDAENFNEICNNLCSCKNNRQLFIETRMPRPKKGKACLCWADRLQSFIFPILF